MSDSEWFARCAQCDSVPTRKFTVRVVSGVSETCYSCDAHRKSLKRLLVRGDLFVIADQRLSR